MTVTMRKNFTLARRLVIDRAMAVVAATGEDIAEYAQLLMVPGHFYETGQSEDETRYEQLTRRTGVVHLAMDYDAYPELGTIHMAPRPVLQPAIDWAWPHRLDVHAEEARAGTLAPAPDPAPITPPVSDAGFSAAGWRRVRASKGSRGTP